MTMSCRDAIALVSSYLDGELSEAQAGPLRAHLLDCPDCREEAKHENALKRWFQAAQDPHAEAPPGFAARVARRVFSGDRGLQAPSRASSEAGSLLPFVLALSAAAAVLLFILSIALQGRDRPAGEGLDADERAPWLEEHERAPIPVEIGSERGDR